MMSQTPSPDTQWRVAAHVQHLSGSAQDPQTAWHQAVAASMVLASDTAGAEPLTLCVGAHDMTTLFPALTDAGELDPEATRVVAAQLLSSIDEELADR